MTKFYDFRTGTQDSLLSNGSTAAYLGCVYTATVSGIHVDSADIDPPAFTLVDDELSTENNPDQWLSLSIKSSGRWAAVHFGSATTLQEYTFPVPTENTARVVNIWLGNNYLVPRKQIHTEVTVDPCTIASASTPDNEYKLVLQSAKVRSGFPLHSPMNVFPTLQASGAGTVGWVAIGDKPRGPACLVVEHLSPAVAMQRKNNATPWGMRLRNVGGKPATNIRIGSRSTNQLTVSTVRYTPPKIYPDEDATMFFDVVGASAGGPLSLTITASCRQGSHATDTGRVWVESTAVGVVSGAIPTPTPIPYPTEKDYLVGIWYFNTWGELNQWVVIANSYERRPELGFFTHIDPDAVSWEILWMVNHGIDYMVVEWIDSNGMCPPFLESLRACSNFSYIDYFISFINSDGALSNTSENNASSYTLRRGITAPASAIGSNDDFYVDTVLDRMWGPKKTGNWGSAASYFDLPTAATSAQEFAAANFFDLINRYSEYFSDATYMHTDGMPRVSILRGELCYDYINNINPAGDADRYTVARDAYFANALNHAGEFVHTGIFWCSNVTFNQGGSQVGSTNTDRYYEAGVRRSTRYGWNALTSNYNAAQATRSHSYAKSTLWVHQAEDGILPSLALMPQYNSRRWKDMRCNDWLLEGCTYETFVTLIASAKAYIATVVSAATPREFLICSWNEYGERSSIMPCGEFGFQLLRAVREQLAPSAAAWAPIVPSDVGLRVDNMPHLFKWVECITVNTAADGNSSQDMGVTIKKGAYPSVEVAKTVSKGWIKH